MRTAEDSSGTVLHRLIQEQLRFGNLTDTRALLAIQQQALRGGSSGGGGVGSPRSSLESLTQEETQYIHMSARQEPQGQEHQGDCLLSERSACDLYGLHSEELPTYEEAKALSQYLNSQKVRTEQRRTSADTMAAHVEGQWDLKREHARSLSDRLMQLSLDRNGDRDNLSQSFSRSYPQLYNGTAVPYHNHGGQQFLDPRGPPPDYPVFARLPEYALSHSQEHGQYYGDPPPPLYSQHHRYVSAQSQVALSGVTAASSVVPAPDVLMRENEKLRKELELFTEKATRMQKMESEIQRISEEYETLMRGSAKRETLEKTMRNKLESEIKRMHDFNRDLREQLDTATKQQAAREADQKQNIFVKLLEQKAEQQREREQLERKVQHLRVAGDECRQRRTLLEQKLASAQLRNLQLEEDLQKKTAYIAKVERMQSALAQLQAACEKREVLEQRLRTRLEQELKSLRAQQKQGADPTATASSSFALQQQLREKEECILALEADITKWEQKYLEESTMRQFAMDAAATAAAQRDTTIIKHSPRHSPNSSFNDSLPSHRHQEMKNRIRALHAQLLEKDAVIKVFQQRSRWEQGRSENQGLRLARSVPSINTTACTGTQLKGKSLSDDLTGAAAATAAATLSSQPCAMLKVSNRDVSTQSDEVTQAPPLRAEPGGKKTSESVSAGVTDPVEDPAVPPKTLKSIKSSDAEVVEILI